MFRTTDTPELVAKLRAAGAALRRLARSGGNNAATTNAINRHDRTVLDVQDELVRRGQRELAGALTGEQSVLDNIAARKANSAGHGELDDRLHAGRIYIRFLVCQAPESNTNQAEGK